MNSTTTATSLPKSFETLETLVPQWALATQNERQKKRITSSTGELRAFYDAILPRLEEILAHVDKFPLNELPADLLLGSSLPAKKLALLSNFKRFSGLYI